MNKYSMSEELTTIYNKICRLIQFINPSMNLYFQMI